MKYRDKSFIIAFLVLFSALLFSLSPAAVFAAGEDGSVKGLWLRIPGFPEDAEIIEFNDDGGGEVTYIRSIDDGVYSLSIYRLAADEETTAEQLKEAIRETVAESGGDPEEIDFAGAEEFKEILSYPCMTAEYEIGENEDVKKVAVLGVFTDEFVFLVQASVAADFFEDYSGKTTEWFGSIKLVNGEDGGGRLKGENGEADSWVAGLWIRAAGLPDDAVLEDYSDGDDGNPWFVYSWGDGGDGPAMTLAVGRFSAGEDTKEKLIKLDKGALREFIGSEDFWKGPDSKKLTFAEAPEKISANLTYPCQVVRYSESEIGLSHAALFIETEPFLFMAEITWEAKNKSFKKGDWEEIFSNLELVEQEGGAGAGPDVHAFSLKDGKLFKGEAPVESEVNAVPEGSGGPVRFWSAVDAEGSDILEESETGVWFFAEDGSFMNFLPLDSAGECQDIIFSPDESFFLMMAGSEARPDVTFILYGTETMEEIIEIPGARGSIEWIDPYRFAMTRTDGSRDVGSEVFSMAALRLSVVVYDAAVDEMTVVKEGTATKSFWYERLAEDGASLVIREDSVKSEKDWEKEGKIKTREIKAEIPAAG